MRDADLALVELGKRLLAGGYRFITVTPETHARVNARPENREAVDVPGALGWSRPFRRERLPSELVELLERASMLRAAGDGLLQAGVRASTLGEALYLHSPFPTNDAGAIFFGPDTYRFAQLLEREVRPAHRAADLGCGTGAGGLSIASRVEELLLTDVNPLALRFSEINAAINGASHVRVQRSDVLNEVDGELDLVIANPPYLADDGGRTYRDGGENWGTSLSVRIVRESFPRLARGGRLVMYTGAPVVAGVDRLRQELEPLLRATGGAWRYTELDPDVFGDELDKPAYAKVERIAVVSVTLTAA